MAPSGKRTLMSLNELPVNIRLDHAPVRVVVEGRGTALPVVVKRPVPVSAQGFRQDRPSLRLAEDAAVLLGPGVEQPHPGAFEIVVAVARLHQLQAIGRVQLLMRRLQDDLRLLRRGAAADDRPALGIQPHGGFPVLLAADDGSGIPESADEPVTFEAQVVQDLQQLFGRFIQVPDILRLVLAELLHDVQRVIQLERHKGAFTL